MPFGHAQTRFSQTSNSSCLGKRGRDMVKGGRERAVREKRKDAAETDKWQEEEREKGG